MEENICIAYFRQCVNIKTMSGIHTTQQQKEQIIKKMGRGPEWTFFHQKKKHNKQVQKKSVQITNPQGNANKTLH